jgi:hypothetical protein
VAEVRPDTRHVEHMHLADHNAAIPAGTFEDPPQAGIKGFLLRTEIAVRASALGCPLDSVGERLAGDLGSRPPPAIPVRRGVGFAEEAAKLLPNASVCPEPAQRSALALARRRALTYGGAVAAYLRSYRESYG